MLFSRKALSLSALVLISTASHSQSEETVPQIVQQSLDKSMKKAQDKEWLESIEKYTKIDPKQLESIKKLTEKSRHLLKDSLIDNFDYSENDASLVSGFGDVESGSLDETVLNEEDTVILISMSMPQDLILSAMRTSEENDVPLYLNGMTKGSKNLTDSQKVIVTLAQSAGINPKIAINPLVFRKYDISAVPAIVVRQGDRVAIKYGLLNVDYVLEEANNKFAESQDEIIELGYAGKVFHIEEKDLVEEIKDRFNQKNWDNKKDEAIARFWEHTKLHGLPNATEDATWFIDPTVRVTKDIRNAQGELIAQAGEVKNPLKQFPMQMTYFIINPNELKQIAWLQKKLSTIKGQFQLMITHIDRNRGWEHFKELRQTLAVPIFVMPKEVPERFGVKAVPTIVETTTDGYLKVIQSNVSFEKISE
jgi:conjugal transfer pilus assembly protein TraW